jgi:hypothetical protein
MPTQRNDLLSFTVSNPPVSTGVRHSASESVPSRARTDSQDECEQFRSGSGRSAAGGLLELPLRASNEGLRRPRVARAQETNRLPSLSPIRTTS